MSTLKELSELTGFSAATISRILSGDPTMSASPQTRQRILEAAGELRYPSTKSRRGRSVKPRLRVGLAETHSPAEQLEDPYYLYLKSCTRQLCQEQRIEAIPLLHTPQGYLPAAPPLQGIIAIGTFSPEQVQDLEALCSNLVFLDSSPDELHHDSVVLNFQLGVIQAIAHLEELGHTQIGFAGPCGPGEQSPRLQAYTEDRQSKGLYRPELLLNTVMRAQAACEAAVLRLSQGFPLPTAYIAANEEVAIGLVRGLTTQGLHVPGDISVVSFNDTALSELVEPALTSISTHVPYLSATAVKLVAQRAPTPSHLPERTLPHTVVIPPTPAVRESTAPPRI